MKCQSGMSRLKKKLYVVTSLLCRLPWNGTPPEQTSLAILPVMMRQRFVQWRTLPLRLSADVVEALVVVPPRVRQTVAVVRLTGHTGAGAVPGSVEETADISTAPIEPPHEVTL